MMKEHRTSFGLGGAEISVRARGDDRRVDCVRVVKMNANTCYEMRISSSSSHRFPKLRCATCRRGRVRVVV